jgi:hypothetical protein
MNDYNTLLSKYTQLISNNSDEDQMFYELNTLVSVFCGGKLINIPVFGNCYVFDEPDTPKYLMKCPDLGFIREENMNYHRSYDQLMFVIKECYLKRNKSADLQMLFILITNQLTDFMDGISRTTILETYFRCIEFIEIYKII